VTINLGLVLGLLLLPTSNSSSLSLLGQLLRGQLFLGVPDLWFAVADMRDVATAHLKAACNPNTHGHYIIAHNKTHSFVELARILRSLTKSSRIPTNTLPHFLVSMTGPMLGLSWKWLRLNQGIGFNVDNTASMNELGIVYRPLEETLADHL
jgi:nucleoside-diphosphate-sugar epimerase